ncbi:hypothetical protein PLICRDRAFT_36364 [Plicaturopsis crispa FD-325 SS-3]|nr:hypothetical protein PLICRDRAFT_36364 [Plicaturopsis crispa FD-325 SS-3]
MALLALLLAAVSVSAYQPQLQLSLAPNLTACAAAPAEYSCENTTAIANTCCSPTPGGLVLQTQLWSTYTGLEKKGQRLPEGSWSIHGLWPDNCDVSYEQYCDLSRQYDPSPSPAILPDGTPVPAYNGTPVSTFVEDFGRHDLLDYMNKFWINQGAPNADFWGHEFAKHATCTSTFDVSCYTNYKKHQEVVNFFDAVVRAFKQYPTFDMLASAGIVPSNKTTYSISQVQNALKAQTGALPYVGCTTNGTVLSEVWYFSHVRGSEQYGNFKTVDSTTPTTCNAANGQVWYHERTKGSEQKVF